MRLWVNSTTAIGWRALHRYHYPLPGMSVSACDMRDVTVGCCARSGPAMRAISATMMSVFFSIIALSCVARGTHGAERCEERIMTEQWTEV
jgi:hypothetical protein